MVNILYIGLGLVLVALTCTVLIAVERAAGVGGVILETKRETKMGVQLNERF